MLYKKKKQNCSGDLDPRLHQDIALDPIGGLQLPTDLQLQLFLALPRTHAPIFSPYLATIFAVSAVQIS